MRMLKAKFRTVVTPRRWREEGEDRREEQTEALTVLAGNLFLKLKVHTHGYLLA